MTEQSKIQIIADQLEKQQTDPRITDRTIMDVVGLRRSAYYTWKPKALAVVAKRLQERQAAIQQEKLKTAITQAQNGLKSREERLEILQIQVDALIKQITEAKDVQYVTISGQVQKVNTDMDARTAAYLRRTLRELQAEISKIEGDYSPEKRNVTHNFPEALKIQAGNGAPMVLDYESMPEEILEVLQSQAKNKPTE